MIEPESHKKKENLRQRAYLNSITSVLDYSARLIVGFLLNPFMVRTLGPTFFGVWQMINQLNNYMSTADLNISQPLKLIISRDRSVASDYMLRKQLTVAIFAVFVFLPVYSIVGVFLVWLAPKIIGLDSEYDRVIRSTTALLVMTFLTNQAFSLVESVLRGMNLAYKRMGLRAIIHVFGGVLIACSLYLKFGLQGIAASKLIVAIITGVTLYWIVRKNVHWFGLEKVKLSEVFGFIKLSGWFLGQKLITTLNNSYDILLLGILIGPKIVSKYVITKYLMTFAKEAIISISQSVSPGLGKLFGEQNYESLFRARSQLLSLYWFLGTAVGILICIWNRSFVSIWVGSEYFAGQLETLLIVLIAQQMLIQQTDFLLINLTLNLRKLLLLLSISAFVSITTAFFLIPLFEIKGLLVSLLLGKTIITLGFAIIVNNALGIGLKGHSIIFSKASIMTTLMLIGSAFGAKWIYVDKWIPFISGVIFSLFVTLGLLWIMLLGKKDRRFYKDFFLNVILNKRP